jgi:hypothetical protein
MVAHGQNADRVVRGGMNFACESLVLAFVDSANGLLDNAKKAIVSSVLEIGRNDCSKEM